MMTDEQFRNFKASMLLSVEEFVANGGKLITGLFGHKSDKACCPVECLVPLIPGNSCRAHNRLQYRFGFPISEAEIWNFIDGFDDRRDVVILSPAMHQFGQELRAKYILNQTETSNDA